MNKIIDKVYELIRKIKNLTASKKKRLVDNLFTISINISTKTDNNLNQIDNLNIKQMSNLDEDHIIIPENQINLFEVDPIELKIENIKYKSKYEKSDQ